MPGCSATLPAGRQVVCCRCLPDYVIQAGAASDSYRIFGVLFAAGLFETKKYQE